jgi:zinc transport system ATP-binding protein
MDAQPASASRPEPLLRARGLRVVRGQRPLLQGIDLELRPRELLTLVGPNGAGKSTLLKALIGLMPVSGGDLWLRPGLQISYVPQDFRIDHTLPMPVMRFLTLQLRRFATDIGAVAAETGIEHLLGRPMQGLSGGERRRVLLARALLREPDLLALDEPAAGLDVQAQAEIYELIQSVCGRRDCAVVVVSHDLHLVMAASDSVLCLNEGHLCCRGAPASVVEHPEYQALFGHQLGAATGIFTHRAPHVHGPECRP